jgi:hypothetical protein
LKASQKNKHQILVERFEEILKDLANIPDFGLPGTVVTSRTHFAASIKRLAERYPETFGNCTEAGMLALRDLLRKAWASADFREREWYVFLLRRFHADAMRRAQAVQKDDGKDLLREWQSKKEHLDNIFGKSDNTRESPSRRMSPAEFLFHFIDSEEVYASRKSAPPPISDFESAAFHLQRSLHRARYCAGPECQAPYFFIEKKGQRYCSPDCARPVQRENKRRWWQQNRARPKRRKQE